MASAKPTVGEQAVKVDCECFGAMPKLRLRVLRGTQVAEFGAVLAGATTADRTTGIDEEGAGCNTVGNSLLQVARGRMNSTTSKLVVANEEVDDERSGEEMHPRPYLQSCR